MKRKLRQLRRRKGQVIVLFAVLLPVMLLFAGLGVDMGLMYLTKSRLVRATDSTALRVVRRFEQDDDRIRTLAIRTMQANYPGFLANKTGTSGEWTKTTTTDSDGATVTTHEITGGSGQKLEFDIKTSVDLTDVIIITLRTSVRHTTHFMPIADAKYRTINFGAGATAERFPACNVLILDISGSMRSGSKDVALVNGVQSFSQEFVEDRDYMAVFTYSTVAKGIFPDVPNGSDEFWPTQYFNTGIGGDTNRSVPTIMTDKVRFAGVTNAAEGLRMAFLNTDAFLNNFDAETRKKIKVHYVFFTDGDFNTFRGFGRGIGYGIDPGTNINNPESGQSYRQHSAGSLPFFHYTRPINASNFVNSGDFTDEDGNDLVFTNYSSSTGTSYNLVDHVYNVDLTTLGGVNAVFMGNRLKNASWRDGVTGSGYRTGNRSNRTYWPTSWSNRLMDDAGNLIASPTNHQIQAEMTIQRRDHGLAFPVSFPHSWDSSDPDQAEWEAREYFPGGRTFANHEGTYWRKNSSSLGPDDGVTGNFDSWNIGTTPLTEWYPEYRYGGPLNYVYDNNSDGKINSDDFDENDLGPPLGFYSFRRRAWTSLDNSDESKIRQEGDWQAESQAWIARIQHDATVFAIMQQSGRESVMRRLANEQSDGTKFYNDQKLGKYYFSSNADELEDVFREIAQRISVRLAD